MTKASFVAAARFRRIGILRQKFAQEELWDELSDNEQQEAIERLMDACEYEQASKVADHSIDEAVARYLHDVSLDKVEQSIVGELTC